MAGEEDTESDTGIGHKHFYSTLQNNVYKWTNIATCRLCLTNLRPTRTVRIAYFFRRYMIFLFCFTCLWSFALSSRNLGSPITKCGAAGELIKDYIPLFSHDRRYIALYVFDRNVKDSWLSGSTVWQIAFLI
jgi:hypothetical protein